MNALVLIVDSDLERLERVKRLVETEGAVALLARDSREAMFMFTRREPLLTLLNVDPLVGLGLEVCRDMKALRAGRRRMVVVLAPRETRGAAFDAGCNAFVVQATETLALRRAVRRFLAVAQQPSPDVIELIA